MNVLITGASRGLGKSICVELLKQKHKVTGISRGESQIEHKNYNHISTDLGKEKNIRKVKDIVKEGEFDIIINNASILKKVSIKNSKWANILESLENNLMPSYEISKTCLKMNSKKNITIVNIASLAGLERYSKLPNLLPYTISKSAVVSLTQCLYQEIEEKSKISIFCIAPGLINTDMSKENFEIKKNSGISPEYLGKFIIKLATDWRVLMNGKVIDLDTNHLTIEETLK